MAIDEVLASGVAQGQELPTLRLYGWMPPCVSIGRFQPVGDIRVEALQRAGVDLVRRITGGRALLHKEEVTYAVLMPKDHAIAQQGILESYRQLSAGLLATLQLLSLEADMLQPSRQSRMPLSAACMEVPSPYEILVSGRKLIGSAQCRRADYVLQHGSLPLTGHAGELLSFLQLNEESRERLQSHLHGGTTTVVRELSAAGSNTKTMNWQVAAEAMVQGFACGLELEWEEDTYRPDEMEAAARLIRERYANEEWTRLK